MKTYKSLSITLLTSLLVISAFFIPTTVGHAQTDFEWSEPINLSNSGASTDPSMIVDNDGVIHVIWIDEFDGYKYVKSADGVTWSRPVTVDFPFLPENPPPQIIITTNGSVHFFWVDDDDFLYYTQTRPQDLATPAAWGNPVQLGVSVLQYDIQVDALDGLHLGFIKNKQSDNALPGIYYRRSTNRGFTWSSAQFLYESQYFRSVSVEDVHISLAVRSDINGGQVYLAWDNPAQKKIYMSISADLGKTWSASYEVVGPEEKTNYATPHSVEIDIAGNDILLMWQTGWAGRCAQNGRLSKDGGTTWEVMPEFFAGVDVCSTRLGFVPVPDEYFAALFKIQESLAVAAWNGNRWSELQIQSELSVLQNPITLDPITLGCQQAVVRADRLYVVGCDLGNSGDIWFISRTIGAMADWFPPVSAWGPPLVVASVSHDISSVSSIADTSNIIHTVWVNSTDSRDENLDRAIYYASWNKVEWSRPIPIMTNLDGIPNQLSLSRDNQGRLLLVWVDETNQTLMFSWANSNRAGIPLEWIPPIVLPVPARLVGSPSILTDDAGNIVVVYSVPFNENRGIYVTRSSNLGKDWSVPARAFDGMSAGWDSIDKPSLAMTGDGRLHLFFTRISLVAGLHPVGLSYLQSDDGGYTWSEPTLVRDGQVGWGRIAASDGGTLNLLWEEKRGDVFSIFHRVSTDSGQSWGSLVVVTSTEADTVLTTSTTNMNGQLHLLQIASVESPIVQDWIWDGTRWSVMESTELPNTPEITELSEFISGITHDGYLYAMTFMASNDPAGNPDNRLIGIGRFIDSTSSTQDSDPVLLTMPAQGVVPATPSDLQDTPAPAQVGLVPTVPSRTGKNVVGLIMVVVVFVLLVVIIRPVRSSKRK